jgi:VWFA-related protein
LREFSAPAILPATCTAYIALEKSRMPIRHRRAYPLQFFVPLFCALLIAWPVFAQEQPRPQPKDDATTLRVDTDLVSLEVAVMDRAGKQLATNLRAADFVVYEDGVRQQIVSFAAADVPFNLVLLVDTSGSTRDDVALMRRAVQRFLTELAPKDRVALIQFNKEVELLEDLTTERAKIENALKLLKPGSGTSFYDAMHLTIDEVLKKVDGRKAIVALTDGVDSYGHLTFERVLPALEQTNATVYFLELDTEAFTEAGMLRDCLNDNHFEFSQKQLKKYHQEESRNNLVTKGAEHCLLSRMERTQINRRLYETARRELREMADKSGGRVYPVKQVQQLDQVYSQIAAELRTQYSLAYYPSNEKHDGKWRTVRVEIKPPGLAARTRPGYRAPRD